MEWQWGSTIQDLGRIPWVGHCVTSCFNTPQRWALRSKNSAFPFTKKLSDAKTEALRGLEYKNQMALTSDTRNRSCVSFELTWGKAGWRHQPRTPEGMNHHNLYIQVGSDPSPGKCNLHHNLAHGCTPVRRAPAINEWTQNEVFVASFPLTTSYVLRHVS